MQKESDIFFLVPSLLHDHSHALEVAAEVFVMELGAFPGVIFQSTPTTQKRPDFLKPGTVMCFLNLESNHTRYMKAKAKSSPGRGKAPKSFEASDIIMLVAVLTRPTYDSCIYFVGVSL